MESSSIAMPALRPEAPILSLSIVFRAAAESRLSQTRELRRQPKPTDQYDVRPVLPNAGVSITYQPSTRPGLPEEVRSRSRIPPQADCASQRKRKSHSRPQRP